MIMRRLKRLIGSFYHQKRIDIIMADNAHYVCAEGQWVASYYYQHWTNWDLFMMFFGAYCPRRMQWRENWLRLVG